MRGREAETALKIYASWDESIIKLLSVYYSSGLFFFSFGMMFALGGGGTPVFVTEIFEK